MHSGLPTQSPKYSGHIALVAAIGIGITLAAANAASLPGAALPVIDRFELVASDGGGTYIWNSWGMHQTRITRHADGTIRLIYSTLSAGTNDAWRLMKKQGEDGPWKVEASGEKFDDVFLLRDPLTDKAHVIASPNSVRTVYSSPVFAPVTIPGTWPYVSNTARQYSGAGIGADGTLCFKNSEEMPSPVENSDTHTAYICGNMSAAGKWQWHSKINRPIGLRYAYDYVFPGTRNGFRGFVATAQRNLHKTAAAWPNASYDYIFDGIRFYKSEYASSANWFQTEIVRPLPTSAGASAAPTQRLHDAYLDSQQRVIVTSFREDPANPAFRGFYVTVSDVEGNVQLEKKWTIPSYGYVRLFEASANQLWLLWTNADASATKVHLYHITVVTSATFDLRISGYTNLSSRLASYRTKANVFLALPRGGNQIQNFIDGLMIACGTTYPAPCNGPDKLLYFRIRLPGT